MVCRILQKRVPYGVPDSRHQYDGVEKILIHVPSRLTSSFGATGMKIPSGIRTSALKLLPQDCSMQQPRCRIIVLDYFVYIRQIELFRERPDVNHDAPIP